jgi:hypothetical protein
MTEKTGTIQTTGNLWKLMVVANAEAIVASCRTGKILYRKPFTRR